MKRSLFLFLFSIIVATAYTQVVSDVTFRLENGKVAVSFTLHKPWRCNLSYSTDGGANYIPCQSLSGNVINKTTGIKTIYWDYFADGVFYGSFLFKVEAEEPEAISMIFVKDGTFQMGSNDGDNDEKPVHTVILKDFYIGKYEVTQAQWQTVMGYNPSGFKGDDLPVENVSWNDVQKFIEKLNQLTGKNYRLPTEAEWEYAARGGNKSRGYKYAGSNNIDDTGWFSENAGGRTHIVGEKSPNELGIYDMCGNVYEWCADWYNKDYYVHSPRENPSGPSFGDFRVIRGGSWSNSVKLCRVTERLDYGPSGISNFFGFRLARSVD